MSAPDDDKPPRPGLDLLRRAALGAMLIFVLSAGAVASAGLLEVDELIAIVKNESAEIPGIEGALDDVDPGKPPTILVLGTDRRYIDIRQKNPVRADTLLLVRLDPSRGATAVMSIPRDLRVNIRLRNGQVVTDKINAAYALGGPRLSVQTVKSLLKIPINHVVNVNFDGFRRAVNRLGCVYVDVDRDYFNDNNPPNGGGPDYATIDVDPGYQKLKGQDALDYVRYRLFDNDFVRAARQQDFLRQARLTPGVRRLLENPFTKEMARIFRRYVQVDRSLRSTKEIFKLLRLAIYIADKPIREVPFRYSTQESSYVRASTAKLRESFDAFMATNRRSSGDGDDDGASAAPRRRKARRVPVPRTLTTERAQGETFAAGTGKLGFPFYFPTRIYAQSRYDMERPRIYTIRDELGRRQRAYRLVLRKTNGFGEYYGVQGTTWKDPPILDNPSRTLRQGKRTLRIYNDGRRVALVAWKTRRAVYWVSNTLTRSLNRAEMIGIAASLRRLGQR